MFRRVLIYNERCEVERQYVLYSIPVKKVGDQTSEDAFLGILIINSFEIMHHLT